VIIGFGLPGRVGPREWDLVLTALAAGESAKRITALRTGASRVDWLPRISLIRRARQDSNPRPAA
jgi:hypothetical protein